jgi:hypothetical protein
LRDTKPFFSKVVDVLKSIAGTGRTMSRKWFMGTFLTDDVEVRFTAVEPITFRAVCEAIAKYAFVTSDLPVIISLEIHCRLEQQQKIVEVTPPRSYLKYTDCRNNIRGHAVESAIRRGSLKYPPLPVRPQKENPSKSSCPKGVSDYLE